MSRIGKLPIVIPAGVTVEKNNEKITVSGKTEKLVSIISDEVTVEITSDRVIVKPASNSRKARSMWGLSRTLINNMVHGVTTGFVKKLEVRGVGYKASVEGKLLRLSLGFSHEIIIEIPAGLTVKTPKPTEIEIAGADTQKVGELAALIRSLRKPEPYKGKGVRYEGERVIMKEGKKK